MQYYEERAQKEVSLPIRIVTFIGRLLLAIIIPVAAFAVLLGLCSYEMGMHLSGLSPS